GATLSGNSRCSAALAPTCKVALGEGLRDLKMVGMLTIFHHANPCRAQASLDRAGVRYIDGPKRGRKIQLSRLHRAKVEIGASARFRAVPNSRGLRARPAFPR